MKHWAPILHVLAMAVVFLTPSVRAFAASHLAYSALLLTGWGILLAYLRSPLTPNPGRSLPDPKVSR